MLKKLLSYAYQANNIKLFCQCCFNTFGENSGRDPRFQLIPTLYHRPHIVDKCYKSIKTILVLTDYPKIENSTIK